MPCTLSQRCPHTIIDTTHLGSGRDPLSASRVLGTALALSLLLALTGCTKHPEKNTNTGLQEGYKPPPASTVKEFSFRDDFYSSPHGGVKKNSATPFWGAPADGATFIIKKQSPDGQTYQPQTTYRPSQPEYQPAYKSLTPSYKPLSATKHQIPTHQTLITQGYTGQVPVMSYGAATPAYTNTSSTMSTPSEVRFQVGSFGCQENAQGLRDTLAAHGFSVSIEQSNVGSTIFYRVIASRLGSEEQVRDQLLHAGTPNPILLDNRGIIQNVPGYNPIQTVTPASDYASSQAPKSALPAAIEPAPIVDPVTRTALIHMCTFTNTRIEATGQARPGGASPNSTLITTKAAVQTAKRNLLLCIQSYKEQWAGVPLATNIEGFIPDRLLIMSRPNYLPDGTVKVQAGISIQDANNIKITRLE
ncbi:hypothetical protein DSUL_50226 [Desulfovibrionales bacterium]